MITSATETDERAVEADVTDSDIMVRLTDGRAVSVPLAWFPRLFAAPVEDRKNFELIGDGIGLHWPTLDEDLSVAGLVHGVRPQSSRQSQLVARWPANEQLDVHISTLPASAPSADDEKLRRFHATLAGLERDVQKFVCPIYGIGKDEGKLIGSGFLLKIKEKTILVTAAHVLEARGDLQLQIPGQTRIVPFGGTAYSTGFSHAASSATPEPDVAFMVLDTDTMVERPSTATLKPEDLGVDDLPDDRTAYGFVGFPGSENEPLPDFRFPRNSYYYGGQPAGKDRYERLDYDPRTHFIMAFERERMFDREVGRYITVSEPYGMSGGPVFKLGTFEEIDGGAARPRVIALAIQWWQKLDVLVGVRIGLLTESIRQLLPEMGAVLPIAPHFRSDVALDEIDG